MGKMPIELRDRIRAARERVACREQSLGQLLADKGIDYFRLPKPAVRSRSEIEADFSSVCESPIEKMFFRALERCGVRFQFAADGTESGRVVGCKTGVVIVPQHTVSYYCRIDFAFLFDTGVRFAVELDGYEFHERTKDQAQRDKTRDRELNADAWRVLRYTGSEVFQNADRCVLDVFRIASKLERHES